MKTAVDEAIDQLEASTEDTRKQLDAEKGQQANNEKKSDARATR
ncbi:MAG: hypothetical protein WD070_12400 [Pirellulaceae bacterium]